VVLGVITGRLRGRSGRLAAQASVLASVVAGTVAYAHGEGVLVAARSEHVAAGRAALTAEKAVTLVADGRTRDVTTTAATVADLLAEQKVTVGPADQLTALPTSPVVDGLVVALTRIERRRVTVTETVAPPMVQQPSADLQPGEHRVVRPGRPGMQHTIYEVVLADGRPTSRTELAAVLVRAPMPRIVQVGGRRRKAVRPGVDGLNWTALARCESGGNPRAVNPAGYYGLFQFSAGTWRAVGGSGLPSDAPSAEQLYRAKLLFQRGGAGQWGCGRHLYD
jgi:resuscitation-promoting factor RpfB